MIDVDQGEPETDRRLERSDGRHDTSGEHAPDYMLGIDLRNHFPDSLKKANKPLAMPVKMYFHAVVPGKYRVRGYWNKDVEHTYTIKDDFWKRSGNVTIATAPKVVIRQGVSTEVALFFKFQSFQIRSAGRDGRSWIRQNSAELAKTAEFWRIQLRHFWNYLI